MCGAPLRRHSTYKRKVIVDGSGGREIAAIMDIWNTNGDAVKLGNIDSKGRLELILVRVHCLGPKRHTHVLLPDFVIPHVRHLRTTYEKVLNKKEPSIYLEPSTKRRIRSWWDKFATKFKEVVCTILTMRCRPPDNLPEWSIVPDNLRTLTKILVNLGIWLFPRTVKI